MSQAETLLRTLLARVRRARALPLQFGLEGEDLARTALRETQASVTLAELDALVLHALGAAVAPTAVGAGIGGDTPALAAWLERLYAVARRVHPRAIDLVALRIEGWDDRDIAAKLELGLRLVGRIRAGVCRDLTPSGAQACLMPC